MSNKIELLAPAGSMDKMRTAFAFGADAVYLGTADFSLRVRINTFDMEKMKEAVIYAHKLEKKVYVTLNIFAHNIHIENLEKYLKDLKKIGIDAIIASDPGIIKLIRDTWSDIDIHLSTQANCTNWMSAKFWQEQGIKRIILGREVKLNDIKEIKGKCPNLELEYFVHGAMCMAYSGRCFLSKHFMNRSANLGDCVQPCRWKYYISEEKRLNDPLEISEDSHGSYILNSRDLCLIEYLDKLKEVGVDSFKIEGRNKSVYYLANVCGIYNEALELLEKNKYNEKSEYFAQELKTKLTNRGYTTGFLFNKRADETTDRSQFISDWEFCGEVLKNTKDGSEYKLKIRVHNSLKINDDIEIISPNYRINKIKISNIQNANNNENMTEAHGGGSGHIVVIKTGIDILVFSVLRRKVV